MQVGKYVSMVQGNLLHASYSYALKLEVAKSWYSVPEDHNHKPLQSNSLIACGHARFSFF
jgi:hypothetical protein